MTYYKPGQMPFYFRGVKARVLFDSVPDFPNSIPQIAGVMKSIAAQKDIRHTVLDTWNLVDFVLRRNLTLLFGLQEFETLDFDPKYDLLPRSFEELLKCAESFKKSQAKLTRDADPFDSVMKIPLFFLMRLKKNNPVNYEWFIHEQEKYYQEELPVAWKYLQENQHILQHRRPKNLSGAHRDLIDGMDDSWFESVRRLNKARNKAAHTLDGKTVAQVFGIAGPGSLRMVKKNCLALLKSLLGLKRPS